MKKINLKNQKEIFKEKIKTNKFSVMCNKLKNFIVKEDDYMIFLIMILITSFLLEPYGFTRTLPLVIIVPFLLATFYKGRKRILIHTVIGMIVLASVSPDIKASSLAIVVTTICTFTGLFLSKYVDHLKKYNIFKKIFYGLFAFTLLMISIFIYATKYGMPTDYFKANKAVDEYLADKDNTDLYAGTTFNADKGTFDVVYVSREDLSTEKRYSYNVAKKKLILDNDVELIEENDNN